MPLVREMYGVLERELGKRNYLAGAAFSPADMFLLPLIHYIRLRPDSAVIAKASPNVEAWFARVSARPSAVETVPPPMPGRGRRRRARSIGEW